MRERGYPKHIISQHKQIKFHERDTSTHKSTANQQITTSPPHKEIRLTITTSYNHHHRTIQRLVNKHWTTFRTKQKGNPELPQNITMCYRRNPSLRNKLAKTRHIQEMATNEPTLNPHCTNKCLNRKCPTCPNILTRHPFLSTTLGTTHTTKCNYTCRSTGIVYLSSHLQKMPQTVCRPNTRQSTHMTIDNESRCETQHLT